MIINSIGYAQYNYGFAEADTDTASKEEFLTLLVTQLQNQDPLDPMKNEDFVAQLAQFNSLEQMINLNESMESQLVLQTLSSASNLLGKEVSAISSVDSEEGYTAVTGTVESVWLEEGAVVLRVNTESGTTNVLLGDVVGVN